ncbi:PQQ-binding-like beta-propeller repeat protein [Streptomyces sp. NPDC057418]|uniref:serine/threonine-protein kinase n=1 Tax=Streptomyces sp. NPDC057418 TaxID=3346126 RepID=UPI00367BDECB
MLKPLLHDDPQHIAGYRLVARLGSGGMGTVYLARSPGGRTVALKTVHARIAADTTFRTRFRLEVDAARVIGGVHGAQVFDADPLADMPWLATEYILGPPLDEAVAGHGPLPETAVRAMGAALCGALGQLHRSDVVHRDLKPSNVMLSAYGPKIIDFGIARALGDARLTRTGTAAGTPAYMSPEQASGQDQTPAGDVFALAGVLVFAATGHGPFGGGQAADLLYRVRYADPDLTGVPPALAPVLARCLAKDPSLRPRTTDLLAELHDGHGEFADHLPAGLLSGIARLAAEVWRHRPERLPAPPEQPDPGPGATAPRRTGLSRRRVLTSAGLAATGVAAAGAGAWFWTGLLDRWKPGGGASEETGWGKQGPLRTVWTNDTAKAQDRTPPFFVGDDLVVMGMFHLVKVDPITGTNIWELPISSSDHVVSDGSGLYYIRADGEGNLSLLALDMQTARPKGTVVTLPDLQTAAALICASDGTVYLVAGHDRRPEIENRRLLAMDTVSGKLRWQVPFTDEEETPIGIGSWFAKAIRNVLVIGDFGDRVTLQARDRRSGKHLWTREIRNWMAETTAPVASGAELADDGTHLYIGASLIHAIRISDGAVIWEFGSFRDFGDEDLQSTTHYGAPVVRGGVVYAAEATGSVVAVDTRRGELLWEVPAPKDNLPRLASPPVLGPTHLYYEGESGLGAIDLHTHAYVRTLKASLHRFTVDADKRLLIGVGEERMEALRME